MSEESESKRPMGVVIVVAIVFFILLSATLLGTSGPQCEDAIYSKAKHGDPEIATLDKLFNRDTGNVRYVNGFGVWTTYEYICLGKMVHLEEKH